MIDESIDNTLRIRLRDATKLLQDVGISSASLDAEIILAHVLHKGRTWLHAHNNEVLADNHIAEFEKMITRRLKREPIAYIISYKEFFGRDFKVTTDTLIPRPESEDIVSAVKSLFENSPELFQIQPKLIDVGTSSGCLGISLKLELPNFDVTLSDISQPALDVAKNNADILGAKIKTLKCSLLDDYPHKADFIVANLPYVDPAWERSPETDYEPSMALFADNGGLELMIKLISQAESKLKPNGYLILEADPEQHPALQSHAKQSSLKFISNQNYCVIFQLA